MMGNFEDVSNGYCHLSCYLGRFFGEIAIGPQDQEQRNQTGDLESLGQAVDREEARWNQISSVC